MEKKRFRLAFWFDLALVAMEIFGAFLSFRRQGSAMFRFYTEDSNLLALAACAAAAAALAKARRTGGALPRWAAVLKYAAVCCLSLTFLVVLLVLAPMMGAAGFRVMFLADSMLFHHLLCPLLALASFLFADPAPVPGRKAVRAALAPTAVYAVVTVVLNLTGALEGPYPFLRVYAQPWWASVLWCGGIVGGAWGICRGVLALRRAAEKKRNG